MAMWLVQVPGVYRPQGDTRLLAEALGSASIPRGSDVLDVGTGTGALAVAAVEAGAGSVTAVDVSFPAAMSAWFNTRFRGAPVTVRCGDAWRVTANETFDVVLANLPYVPGERRTLPKRGRSLSWEGGLDGRQQLDRLCARVRQLVRPNGIVLLVHSALCGVETTLRQLRDAGLKSTVVARRTQPFGPIMNERAAYLERAGLIEPGQRHEELVVIRGDRTDQAIRQAATAGTRNP